ncbi:methyl-accepting chemotaxis protein [Desulfocurvibacter africanus]|uniref:Methyl-accepting chemotaxis sensory transducer with Pas/Pac sensor n=1 Tax=Desulfocurvibacter africanus subsp. africanus str. Walvis Bay TaxID=690850 RepID=F3Z451_DESAF|nr:methyl-accepting chemotaxis protein [Desulfocurvibacter africanus]EGJ51593.1 methyl-accepting chemotaxis sensory transducer with Pas/Pac sensor [Desulfocurvibacter africanus subsp. africanus str. Walvis Bay]
MSLRYKISIPLIVAVIVLGTISYFVTNSSLVELKDSTLAIMVDNKAHEVEQGIEQASLEALGLASLFSKLPEVAEAYEVAFSGNINDEKSPQSQQAREMLRRVLAPTLAGYKAAMGSDLKLHFHLPNGRSLLRAWWKQNVQRKGQWLDISDDISGFRQTVLDVNRSGQNLKGIELGRGGFEVRGVLPVFNAQGRQLGSVEILFPFNPIMERASKGKGQSLVVYMNAEGLEIATGLSDESKNPRVGSKYVLLSGSSTGEVEKLVNMDLLDRARQGLSTIEHGSTMLAGFPIKDYQGKQTGVVIYAMDTARQVGIIRNIQLIFVGVMAALLIVPTLIGGLFVSRFVVTPTRGMISKIKDIAEDRANLKDRLDDSQRDEIGELATWFNRLMGKIDTILCDVQGYVNMVNAVPDPIFSVDDNFRILQANTATQTFLGKAEKELKGNCCHEFFKTSVCKTDKCPIAMAKKLQGAFKSDIIDLSRDGKVMFIQPAGDILRDCDGNRVGYVEVARNVTELVLKEREIHNNLGLIKKVNNETRDAASQIAAASDQIMTRLEDVNEGASKQRDRATETATAMEQMNATVLEVARNASEASKQADATRTKALEGAEVVSKAVEAISQVRDRSMGMKATLGELGGQAESIGRIMSVINDIADQTNLLALNAAIEAARAGDAGRGFAVVADEVRKLAEKTMTATKEVGEAISAIQRGTESNIKEMDRAVTAVESAVVLANNSGTALQEIVKLVNTTTDQVRSIATAAEEQSSTSEQIGQAIVEVNRIAGDTAQGMSESVQAISELVALADRLRDLSNGDGVEQA